MRAPTGARSPCRDIGRRLAPAVFMQGETEMLKTAAIAKWHTHTEANGDVVVCSTTGTRTYRWIQDLGPRRVSGDGTALPGELLAVSALIPEPNVPNVPKLSDNYGHAIRPI